MEYQLPRFSRMWTHLERQAGSQVKGVDVDKQELATKIGSYKKKLESVRKRHKQNRDQRTSVPVVSLVGYTNAGKSTILNQLTGAGVVVLAEDQLFATLDITARRVQMKNGSEFLLADTVGFIQKLPTTLVAAFRATLEEISESSLLVHVVDVSHPLAAQQIVAVENALLKLNATSMPKMMVWNKVDKFREPEKIRWEAKNRRDVVCISALTGEGMDDFCSAVQKKLKDTMVGLKDTMLCRDSI